MGGNALLWYLIFAVVLVVPFWKLLPRYGINKFYALFAGMPAIAIVLLWIIAFKDEVESGRDT